MPSTNLSPPPQRLFDAETKDVQVDTVAAHWNLSAANREALERLFRNRQGLADYERVRSRCARPTKKRTIIYLSYENPWGKAGGIEAVARMLPVELRKAGEQVMRLSPLHHRLVTAESISREQLLGRCQVVFENEPHDVAVYCCADPKNEEWILFENTAFFGADGGVGRNDPYVYSRELRSDRDGESSRLLRDALFASKAVPELLRVLQGCGRLQPDVVVHAQDWQFASAALTVKEALLEEAVPLPNTSVVLTLHNPYDHGLSRHNLQKITRRYAPGGWPPVGDDKRATVLTRMIPLTDAPVSTVSRVFAQEFTRDPLQTGHFAGHFQDILRTQQIVGIDNGLFVAASDDPDPAMARDARRGRAAAILEHKREQRRKALTVLPAYLREIAGHKDKRVHGKLSAQTGGSLADLPDDVLRLPDNVPLFMMVGRLDPGQKGFDVFARAIEAMPPGAARYIISPLSPTPDDPDIGRFLHDLITLATEKRPGEVLLLPFKLDPEPYLALRAGVSWSVWPSLYEPFGGVTEFYLAGTPVVARAVGGLRQQVIGYREDPAHASGILYREPVGATPEMERQHKQIQDAEFPTDGQRAAPVEHPKSAIARPRHARAPDGQRAALAERRRSAPSAAEPPLNRTDVELYRQMVAELAQALQLAVAVCQQPDAYGRILGNLPLMSHCLSWQRSVDEYRRWYDLACR